MLDRWSAKRTDAGVYVGTALRALASQREHQRGLLAFFDMLCSEVAYSQDYELLAPTQRSQIAYRDEGTGYVIHPDSSSSSGTGATCARACSSTSGGPRRRRAPERLDAYRRYFGSGYARPDHGGQLPLVLFVFESTSALCGVHSAHGTPLPARRDHLDPLLGRAHSEPRQQAHDQAIHRRP